MNDTPIFDDQSKNTPIYDEVNKPEPIYGNITGEVKTVNSKTPQRKVLVATAGAGVGPAVAEIIIYGVESIGKIDIPDNVEGAIAIVVSAVLAFVGGYYTKNK